MKHLCFLMIMLLLLSSLAQATTYYVATTGNDSHPGTQAQPFRTIGKGIAVAAADGDTILVVDGTYNEHDLNFGVKNLVLQSQSNNPAACILDCQQLGYGIFIAGEQTAATVSGLTIRNALTTINHRGAVYFRNSVATVTNCLFTGNRFNVSNGLGADALYVDFGSNVTVTNCTFSANGSSGAGVVAVAGGSAALANCTFANNTSSALFQSGGTCTVTRCTFTGNFAYFGGGIYKEGGGMQATACIFQSNQSINFNSTVFNHGGNLTLSSSLIYGDEFATEVQGGTVSLTNCTIVGPRVFLRAQTGGSLSVANSIIWGDSAANTGIYVLSGSTGTVTYSNVRSGYTGTGNINADPLFVNAATGNYHLQSTSPCLNTGSATAPNLPATDLDCAPRILGSAPDMGAFEFWTAASSVWFVDKVLGNDTNAGSPTAPFKTVVKAIATASNGHSIYIKQGNYGTDRPRITKSLRLFNWRDTGLSLIGQP